MNESLFSLVHVLLLMRNSLMKFNMHIYGTKYHLVVAQLVEQSILVTPCVCQAPRLTSSIKIWVIVTNKFKIYNLKFKI